MKIEGASQSSVQGTANTTTFTANSIGRSFILGEITTDEIVTFPTLESGRIGTFMFVENRNESVNNWNVSGPVKDGSTYADVLTIPKGIYLFWWNNTNWLKFNSGGGSGSRDTIIFINGPYAEPDQDTLLLKYDDSTILAKTVGTDLPASYKTVTDYKIKWNIAQYVADSATGRNIYNTSDSLQGDRVVTGNLHPITFTANGDATMNILNTGSGAGLNVETQDYTAVTAYAANSYGGAFRSDNGYPLLATATNSSANSIWPGLVLDRQTQGATAANGIGISLDFQAATTGGGDLMNSIKSKWTNATYATRTSQLDLFGVNSGTTNNVMRLYGSGQLALPKYGIGTFTGTPAYTLQVDASGNIIEGSVSGGAGTVTAVNAGYAITGGNITVSGTHGVDTNLVTSRLRDKKIIDSMAMSLDNPHLQEIKVYTPAVGVSASNTYSANYPATSIDATFYKLSTTRGGTVGSTEYGGWLTGNLTGDSVKVTAPFWVIIGDSQAEGHPGKHGRLHWLSSGVAQTTFKYDYPDSVGQLSYHLRTLTNMRWYNHGIGGQTLAQVRARFLRDVVGITSNPNDGRGSNTLSRQATGVVVIAGINDVFASRTTAAIKADFEWIAATCLSYGIRCVILNLPGDALASQAFGRQISEINLWLNQGALDQYGAATVDYNTWWQHPSYKSNFIPNTLIVDDIHPSAVGYDSLANYIYRTAKLPKLTSARIYTQRDPAGFTGYSRPSGITIDGIAATISADSSVIALPNNIPDTVNIKITSTTNVTGTTYTGFSHIEWFTDNNITNEKWYEKTRLFTGGTKAQQNIGQLTVMQPDLTLSKVVDVQNYDASTFFGLYGGATVSAILGTQTALNSSWLTVNGVGAGNVSIGTAGPVYASNGSNTAGSRFGSLQIGNTISAGATGYGMGIVSGAGSVNQVLFEHNLVNGYRFTAWGNGLVTSSNSSVHRQGMEIAHSWGSISGATGSYYSLRLNPIINNSTPANGTGNTIGGISWEPVLTATSNAFLNGLRFPVGDNFLNSTNGATVVGDSARPTSGILELNSTNRGLLIPRMTTTQRDAIGYISSFTITNGGTGYTSFPTVAITGSGFSATAYATTTGSVVNFVLPINKGNGWGGLTPTVTITGGGGSGATATANVHGPDAGLQIFNTTTNQMELYDGTRWVQVDGSLTGSASLDFGSTAAQNSADLTITVAGAADGDVVSLGVPNAAVNANSSYTAWVSATNTVTVRFNNYSSGAIDPTAGTFKVRVTK